MTHAIETLQKERDLLEKCIHEGDWSKYPTAKQDRDRKLNQINYALNLLTNQQFMVMIKAKELENAGIIFEEAAEVIEKASNIDS